MGKYIDADTIHWHDDGWACIRKDEYPTIDIVWCKECIFADGKPIADGRYWCNIHRCYMRFCSDGERKESE